MISVAIVVFASSVPALAPPEAVDKSDFHLFNPTPRELLRDMATDRPDTTESPFTVDSGHLQIESSIFDYVRDGDDRALSIMPSNFRLGVANNVEFALVLEPFVRVESPSAPGIMSSDSGFADTELRMKWNLFGNDEGDIALALMPFLILPTASNNLGHGHVEGGLIIPFAAALGDACSFGAMAQFQGVYDPARAEYDLEFLHTATIGRDLIGDLAGYIEYIGIASTAPGSEYQILVGTGLTYALSPDLQLDAGVNIGLAGGAPDLNPFLGFSVRF